VTLRAAVLSTGDELTTGRIVDTNASWIADKLFEIGVELAGADRRRPSRPARLGVAGRSSWPTSSSRRRHRPHRRRPHLRGGRRGGGRALVEDAEQAARIRQLFAALGREMPANNLKQALLPRGAIVIPNALGTAPGYRLAHGAKAPGRPPGVPREMKR